MSDLNISFKIKNYKCFRDEFVGFDKIKPVNIIIGRNNSGKSSMLDILEFLTNTDSLNQVVKIDNAVFQIEDEIYEKELQSTFPNSTGSTNFISPYLNPRSNIIKDWENHGRHLLGLRVKYRIPFDKNYEFTNPALLEENITPDRDWSRNLILENRKRLVNEIVTSFANNKRLPHFFQNKIVRRLHSERDIGDEKHARTLHLELTPNGDGATNIIWNLINNSDLRNRNSVRINLLESLNKIFYPDSYFERITIQSCPNDFWEVCLEEKEKGEIPLSKSGSGLKTVILALLNLLAVPKIKDPQKEKKEISDYLFAFEELENNLHPALLRRLFSYIEDFTIQNKCHFFITTQSNVVIDQFSQSPNAQIIHIVHDGTKSCAITINSFKEQSAVLDDLGAKASDLLQANGIIWLEGPSDRTYFNKWIELYIGGTLKEHRDYECAFYGGSLLAHFESEDPLSADVDAVNILRVNRNAILIGDSDRTEPNKSLKPRLEKMKTAMEKMGAYIWITDAKEIENYIPAATLNRIFKKDNLPDIERYEIFYHEKEKDYWHKNGLVGSFDKVEFAHKIVLNLLKEDLDKRFELKDRMAEICEKIKKWNEDRPTIKQD